MPCTPSAPSWGQSSRGKLLLRSISSARGAIRAAEKARTLSRSCSAVSPRSRRRPGRLLAAMLRRLAGLPRRVWRGAGDVAMKAGATPAALLVFALDVLAGIVLHQGSGDQGDDRAGQDIGRDRVGRLVFPVEPGRDQRRRAAG